MYCNYFLIIFYKLKNKIVLCGFQLIVQTLTPERSTWRKAVPPPMIILKRHCIAALAQ